MSNRPNKYYLSASLYRVSYEFMFLDPLEWFRPLDILLFLSTTSYSSVRESYSLSDPSTLLIYKKYYEKYNHKIKRKPAQINTNRVATFILFLRRVVRNLWEEFFYYLFLSYIFKFI